MKIVIGTKSIKKRNSLEKVLDTFFKKGTILLEDFEAESQVSETPWDKETFDGARNRALHCKKEVYGGDYYIGLESGLVERYGHIFEEAWCCVITSDEKEYYGYSSGLKVPDFILHKMDDLKLEHNQVMKILEDEGSIHKDTWANYSGEVISRSVSLEEALRNAFLQVFATDKSFYNK